MKQFKTLLTLLAFCFSWAAALAQFQVKGVVTESTYNEPVIGASIREQGTTNGTITNVDGIFTLQVASADAVLEISYIGYVSKTLPVAANMNVVLDEDQKALEEVVVTGYMAEKKADLTGSVSVVKVKEVADIATGNVMTSLQGRVPGMNITTDGTPGGTSAATTVRGISSFRSDANGPLYVIDGVMTRENMSSIISANDIESIQVLKDAASAAIYGAQAANGVIIITTKRAREGETKLDFDMSWTWQTYNKGFTLLDADQWGEVYWAAYKYANNGATPSSAVYGNGATPKLQDYQNINGNNVHAQSTDWEDAIYKTALLQNYNINLSRGGKNGSTSLTLNFMDHKGLIMETEFKRFNSRLASDFRMLDNKLRVGENVAVNYWTERQAPGGIEEGVIKQHPAKTVYDEAGEYNDAISDVLGDAPNYVRLAKNAGRDKHEFWRIFGNAYLEIEPIRNLILRTSFGINYLSGQHKTFEPVWARDATNKLRQTDDSQQDYVWTNTINYSLNIDKHNLSAVIGHEAKKNVYKLVGGYGTNLAVENEDYLWLDATTAGQIVSGNANRYSMISYFGKVNYDYASRYLASFTIRRDASSRLSADDNAQVFPSFSLGWRISQEKFMEWSKGWLDDMKIRYSWGKNGNDIIPNDAFYNKYLVSLKDASYNMTGDNSTLAPGAFRSRTNNPELTWETTTQNNIGIDLLMLGQRLNVTVDYFDKVTEDMLVEKPYIGVIGEGGYAWYNGGKMRNRGVEASFSWRDQVKDFNYEATFNLAWYKNKVESIEPDIRYTYGGAYGDKTLEGQPFGSWMGFKTDGLFRTQEEVDEYLRKYPEHFGAPGIGRIRYVDANGDGKINTSDRTWLGSDQPKLIGGLTLNGSWKGFDLSMFFNFMVRDAFNNSKYYTDLFQCWTGNHSDRLLEAKQAYEEFQQTGYYGAGVPALTTLNSNNEHEVSEFYIENGSFIKFKTLTLGYTFPKKWIEKAMMSKARVYVQAQNLFTITNYGGADPETLGYAYPMPRTFSLGLSFGF